MAYDDIRVTGLANSVTNSKVDTSEDLNSKETKRIHLRRREVMMKIFLKFSDISETVEM